jgi:hypothetical protein
VLLDTHHVKVMLRAVLDKRGGQWSVTDLKEFRSIGPEQAPLFPAEEEGDAGAEA